MSSRRWSGSSFDSAHVCCRPIRGAQRTGRADEKRKTWLQQDLEAEFDPMLGLWNRRGYSRGLYRMYFLSAYTPSTAAMADSLPSVISRKVTTQLTYALLTQPHVSPSPQHFQAALSKTPRVPSTGGCGAATGTTARIKIPGPGEGLRLGPGRQQTR